MLIDFVLKKRPLVVFLALALLLAGWIAYNHLPLEAYPDVANLQVRIITKDPGKAAEEVERRVTVPLEKELNGIPRSEPPRSISIFGLSVITVVFQDGVDANVARQQVLEKLAQVDLPPDVSPHLDPNASPVGEIFRYTVESDTATAMERKELQNWVLERKFKSVNGVIDVTSFGGPTKTYQVELDPERMKGLNIDQTQVENAISHANGSTGGSYIVRNDQNYMVRGLGQLTSISDLGNVVVSASKESTPVLLKDISNIAITPGIRVGQVGMGDDDDVVEGIVLMRRGENPSVAVANLMKAWDGIAASLPPGVKLTPLYDRTALVRHTMETIGHSVTEGIVLVVVILMLFLFQIRSALICATVIPLALSLAFVLLNVFGVPGNLLSLGAIDFGIIVDGAIVMVENIVRHLSVLDHSADKQAITACVGRAAKEVAKPILFATSIIIVTFLPIFTFESVEGKLFRPLALTMNFNMIAAVVASLTIIPVLCAVVFCRRRPTERVSPILSMASKIYQPALRFCANKSKAVAAIALAIVVGALCLAPLVGSEFLPELEEGNIWLRVTVSPASVSLDRAIEIARTIRKSLNHYPAIRSVVTQIGSSDDGTDPNNFSNIEVFIDLKPQSEWPDPVQDKQQLIKAMNDELQNMMPGMSYNFSQYIKDSMDEAIAGVKGEMAVKVYGSDLKTLSDLGKQIKTVIQNVPGMVDVACDELLPQPQLVISIDRQGAARYGINTDDILDVVATSVGGRAVTNLIEGERRFEVMLRYKADYRNDSDKLSNIMVQTPTGARVPLSQLASIKEEHGAFTILRDQNERRIAIKANIRGRDLCSAVDQARAQVAKQVVIPQGYHAVWAGQYERAQHASERLMMIVPITALLIFLLLYASLNSARIASLVMLTIPLSLPGGIVALLLTHTHFSISAGVGFIALAGVSVQNGVILVSLVSKLYNQGVSLKEAVFKSASIRMQPALMTTFVATAGLIPAAMATGIGSQSQRPFAIVVAGGLLPAIILSLLVLPALYPLFENFGRKRQPGEPLSQNGGDAQLNHSSINQPHSPQTATSEAMEPALLDQA